MRPIEHLINGELINNNGRTADVFNPSTGEVIQKLALADCATVQKAIDAAQTAYPAWRNTPAAKRGKIMYRFKQLLEVNESKIARLISQEHGKTLEDATGELKRGIENVEYACSAPEILKGEYSRNVGPNIDAWSDFQPLGVVAGITPFNFPAMVPLWMYPLAIVCGNCFILKPSERDPSSTLLIAELLLEAGLPRGVMNVVHGDKEAVDALIAAPEVKALSFVGSTPIAEYIYAEGTKRGKRVQALGGAKNHAVVMPDADLDNAVSALMGAAYGSCGERCMAISVAVCVGDQVADALVAKLAPQIKALKIGAGTSCGLDMGPLVTGQHRDKVRGYVDDGLQAGAELVVDGRNLIVSGLESGFFLGGCLFDHVTPEMRIYQEEIFGPVLCIVRVSSLEEAMRLINDHEYGNGTCIFTRDGEAARLICDEIEVGMVGVNVPLPVPVAYHSFGGWKRSLFGDLHAYGPDGVRFYTRRKAITQRWLKRASHEAAQFAFPSNGVQKSLASFGLIADFDTLDAAIGALGQANTPNEIELVAEVDGKLVGCLAIQRMEGAVAKLFGFHVDAIMQGQCIGRTLLSAGIAQAIIHNFTQLELETWGDMVAAVHLYESLGWVRGPDPLPESGADRFYCLALVRQSPL